jgi:prevent-host-death family protein
MALVRHLSITEARIRLGDVVKRVHRDKEYVVLEKGGVPVAAIVDIDAFEDYLELQDPRVTRIIEEGTKEYRAGKARPAQDLFAELEEEAAP